MSTVKKKIKNVKRHNWTFKCPKEQRPLTVKHRNIKYSAKHFVRAEKLRKQNTDKMSPGNTHPRARRDKVNKTKINYRISGCTLILKTRASQKLQTKKVPKRKSNNWNRNPPNQGHVKELNTPRAKLQVRTKHSSQKSNNYQRSKRNLQNSIPPGALGNTHVENWCQELRTALVPPTKRVSPKNEISLQKESPNYTSSNTNLGKTMSDKNREHEATSHVPDQIFDSQKMAPENDTQTNEEGPLDLSINKGPEPTFLKESEPITKPHAEEGFDEGSQGTETQQPRDETPKNPNQETKTGTQDLTEPHTKEGFDEGSQGTETPQPRDETPKNPSQETKTGTQDLTESNKITEKAVDPHNANLKAGSDPTVNKAAKSDAPGQTIAVDKLPNQTNEEVNPSEDGSRNDKMEKAEETPAPEVKVTPKNTKTKSNVLPKWGKRPGEADKFTDEEEVDYICKSIADTNIGERPNLVNHVVDKIRKTREQVVDTIIENLEADEKRAKLSEKLTKKMPSSAPTLEGRLEGSSQTTRR